MSASDRALRLNAQAVEKLNGAVLGAQRHRGEPDIPQIASDVLSNKRVVDLDGGWSWSAFFFFLLIIGAVIAGTANKTIGAIVMIVFFLAWVGPLIAGFFGMMSEWTQSLTYNPYGGRPAPKCDASGCGSSASFQFDPTGHGSEMKLCYDHKNNFENRVRYAPFFKPDVAKSIVRAYQELVRAAKLDPSSSVIQQNLEQARELAQIVLERKLAS